MLDNQLKRQAQLRESILVMVVMLAMCYASYSTFYAPKKQLAQALKDQISEVITKKTGIEKLNRALEEKYTQQQMELQKQAQTAATQDPTVQIIKKYKDPVYKNMADFLNAIAQVQFRSAVEITTMRYEPPQSSKGYSSSGFFLNITGRFAHVLEFIEKLEKIPALVTLDKVNVYVNKNDARQVMLDLNGTFYELGE